MLADFAGVATLVNSSLHDTLAVGYRQTAVGVLVQVDTHQSEPLALEAQWSLAGALENREGEVAVKLSVVEEVG